MRQLTNRGKARQVVLRAKPEDEDHREEETERAPAEEENITTEKVGKIDLELA